MRIIALFLILCGLAGCASSGAYLKYKPAHWKGMDWEIEAKSSVDAQGNIIAILINETEVISGKVSKKKPETDFKGSYEGYDVSAKCKLVSDGKYSCGLSIGDEMAGQLTF